MAGLRAIRLLCAAVMGSAFTSRSAAPRRCAPTMMAAERVTITLTGPTVSSAFFANQCRRELATFRGLSGAIATGAAPESVVVTAEGERPALESFARWCARGPQDITLEGGAPTADVAFSPATGLAGFECAPELCEVDIQPAADDVAAAVDDEESALVAALIDELS